jgi:hypothetical protein
VDVHTTPCHQLKAPFDKSKIYFDNKNHIYGLKMEVAVSTQHLYYCMHVSKYVPASVHDFELLKNILCGYTRYLDYLLKHSKEYIALPGDHASHH